MNSSGTLVLQDFHSGRTAPLSVTFVRARLRATFVMWVNAELLIPCEALANLFRLAQAFAAALVVATANCEYNRRRQAEQESAHGVLRVLVAGSIDRRGAGR
ncbi:hypothetical protein ACFL6C_07700 [Myxococcota bacterium]